MAKHLGDFLKEQQEPFALEVYLLERGHLRNGFNSEQNVPHCSSKNSTNSFNRSAISALHKKGKFIPNCSNIVRTFFSRLMPVDNDNKIKNSSSGNQDGIMRYKQKVADGDRVAFPSSTIVCNSCSNGDIRVGKYSPVRGERLSIADSSQDLKDNNLLSRKEVAAERKERRHPEENYQISPVSVLEETEFAGVSPILETRKHIKKVQEASSLSISLCHSKPFKSIAKEMQELNGSKFVADYTKNKAMLQTKQLLFDCVKEVVEKQRRKNPRGQQFQKILVAEELRKLIYENIWLWSKEAIDETNIEDLLLFDLLASMGEWSDFEQQTGEIGIEIGDAIFQDISNQIIEDMMNFTS